MDFIKVKFHSFQVSGKGINGKLKENTCEHTQRDISVYI